MTITPKDKQMCYELFTFLSNLVLTDNFKDLIFEQTLKSHISKFNFTTAFSPKFIKPFICLRLHLIKGKCIFNSLKQIHN